MLFCADKGGRKISVRDWEKLYRQREYVVAQFTSIGNVVIETSWMGIAHSSEDPAMMWLVTVNDPSGRTWHWAKTKREAYDKHAELAEKVKVIKEK
jgi:hypothetical protein